LKNVLIMKFGGTSMGSAERIRAAAGIIGTEMAVRPVCVVVSAMAKITDLLLDTLRHAELGDRENVERNLEALLERHTQACEELFDGPAAAQSREQALSDVRFLVAEFNRIAGGILMLGTRPPRSVDEAVAIGERLSSAMLARYLEATGVPAASINAAELVVTDAVFGSASPQIEQTRAKCQVRLEPLVERKVVPVVTGFNGATADGEPTTLGRGGSDFSASILAAAMDAAEVWIWTDVDGIMSADPRLVADAAVLDELTYAEAAELAYNGAKVLHPRTLAPLVEKKIPVWSKNSFAPTKPGTKIVDRLSGPKGVRAVTSMSNVALISMEPANSLISGTRVMARALDALALANVEVLIFTSSSYRQSFSVLVRNSELMLALDALENNLTLELNHGYLKPIEVDENVGLIAVVGEGMRGTPGLAGRIFTAISRGNINIIAIAQGSSELTIGIVVRRDGLDRAVQAVHEECQLGRKVNEHALSR
jgi:bifunctional aspartokinase / homoserine dehydrogenase 1